MAMAIINELKQKYSAGTMLMRLIYINIAVFVVLNIINLCALLFSPSLIAALKWVEVSSNPWEVLVKPWTLITYAFSHTDIFHILFNMLWLYWLGRIFMEYFTSKQLAGLYVLGALGGAGLYLLAYSFLPVFAHMPQSYMLGASASVLAIVVATAVYAPDYKIGLLFIGQISLKWVALVTVMIDLFGVDSLNAGGHIAHIGGAVVGALFGMMMRRGHDITAPLNAVIDKVASLFSRKGVKGPGAPVGGRAYRGNASASGNTAQQPGESDLDRVLAKIKRSGYTALTDEERDILFSFGKKK